MRLHRLLYSPYARKVQRLLELTGAPFEAVDVPYGDREELARLTGGYVYVPVLEVGNGEVVTESRTICAWLLERFPAVSWLVPEGLDGPVWAYCDHVEGPVEDVLFRIATPGVREAWPTAWERALYTLVKERRYGAGCVEEWARDEAELVRRARVLLAPTRATLERHPFLFGDRMTLADLALFGQWAMLETARPGRVVELDPVFGGHMERVATATGPG